MDKFQAQNANLHEKYNTQPDTYILSGDVIQTLINENMVEFKTTDGDLAELYLFDKLVVPIQGEGVVKLCIS